ncbi:restriction endonuclease subunit S [Sphaerospermopsis aphanizomenoides]|uniref:restriction endonuclease subunit S n=1 Tax=Sphaerospermopsis aphanizomenoides TaxID=459663 RepID=UPI001F19410C
MPKVEGHKVFLLSTNMMRMTVNPLIADTKYIYYYFCQEHIKEYIKSTSSGSSQPIFNFTTLKNFQIQLPEINLQQKIAAILCNYDDLIENNTRRIKILEEMAQTLYNEWFVKFRFPGHEQVKMVESELGLIPEGWEVKKLEQLGLLARGKSKHRPRNEPSLFGGNYPFIQTGEVKQASLYTTNYSQTCNEKRLSRSKMWEAGT